MTNHPRPALLVALVALSAALAVAGCSSSSSTTSSASHTTAAASARVDEASVAARLKSGLAGLTSAHLVLDAAVLGATSTADVTLAHGTTTASDTKLLQNGERVEIITVGATGYAKVPAAENKSGKPWIIVSLHSTNKFVSALASTTSLSQASGSMAAFGDFLAAAKSLRSAGSEAVGGVPATHYAMVIVPSKVRGTSPLSQAVHQLDQSSVPVDLWLDAKGRPLRVKVSVPYGGQSLSLSLQLSDFNAPVTITAPPASEVGSH